MDIASILAIATPTAVFSLGAAWGGAKVALNGTRKKVERLEAHDEENRDRLARIETKQDMLISMLVEKK